MDMTWSVRGVGNRQPHGLELGNYEVEVKSVLLSTKLGIAFED